MTAAVFDAVLSDEEVVRRVRDGETALFEILMRRYNQRVYRAVRAILRNDSDAEDVMQQAYLNAFAHLGQFAGNAKFSTWLTRIAVNEALARIRRHHPAAATEETMDEIESHEPDPERQASASQIREVLESEIAALPDHYRSVLVLREVEGLSTGETAECLSVSEDVVKQRLHRARTLLRDNLYARAGVTFEHVYSFGNARCDRVVAFVMATITTP
jgi:RNA polymerase sigma-70 factor (ECF subfamily)